MKSQQLSQSAPSAESTQTSDRQKVLQQAGIGVGVMVGLAFVKYAGMHAVVPFAFGLLSVWLLSKFSKLQPPFVAAVSIQGGHLAWLALGAAVLGGAVWRMMSFDLVILAIGLTWLIVQPSLWPLLILCAYQLYSIIVNIDRLVAVDSSDPMFRAVVLHVVLRLSAWIAMGFCLGNVLQSKDDQKALLARRTR